MGPLLNLEDAVPLIGWTLTHFIWQAAAIYIGFRVLCVLAARRSPQIRYLIGCFALAAMLMSAVTTCMVVSRTSARASGTPAAITVTNTPEASANADEFIMDTRGRIRLPHRVQPTVYDLATLAMAPWIPAIVNAWTAGLVVMTVIQIRGLHAIGQLVLTAKPISPTARYLQLAKKSGLTRAIRYAESKSIPSPATLGFWRPIILLPLAVTCDFSAAELETFVAHELAHIKRNDYLVNLCQVVIETLFFFHPCVWLISSAVRAERELCCDRLATQINTGNTKLYANALFRLADNLSVRSFAMSASGGSLIKRVSALANPASKTSPLNFASLLIVLAVSLGIGSLSIAAITQRAARINERSTLARSPESVFVFNLLKGRADNRHLQQALIDALAVTSIDASLDEPSFGQLVNVLDEGADPEIIWREYRRLEKPGYRPILETEFPRYWPYRSAGTQRLLARLLWRGALAASSRTEAHRRAKAALLVASIHREESGMPAIAAIVMSAKFETNSGFSESEVISLRRYASLAMDELSRQLSPPTKSQ